jgi:hypothetical protein
MRKQTTLKKNRMFAGRLARKKYPIAQMCSVLGCREKGQRHHPDYNKPEEIVWLCQQHHCDLHRGYSRPIGIEARESLVSDVVAIVLNASGKRKMAQGEEFRA